MKMTKKEIKHLKDELTEIAFKHEFSNRSLQSKGRVISHLSKVGFKVSGWDHVGLHYVRGEGMMIWNKAQRSAGNEVSLESLMSLSAELAETFEFGWPKDRD